MFYGYFQGGARTLPPHYHKLHARVIPIRDYRPVAAPPGSAMVGLTEGEQPYYISRKRSFA